MARVAVLDANVLWPQYLRDVLIRASISDLYRAAWTDRILNEMRNSVVRTGRVPENQIDRTVRFMRESCPQFMVDGYTDLIQVMTNDEKDRHVLAAAVHAGADTIVTSNGKDFPLTSREQYGIDLHSPDAFLIDLWTTDTGRMARTLVTMAEGLKEPSLTVQQLIEQHLRKQAPKFAEIAITSGDLELAVEASQEGIPLPSYRPI